MSDLELVIFEIYILKLQLFIQKRIQKMGVKRKEQNIGLKNRHLTVLDTTNQIMLL